MMNHTSPLTYQLVRSGRRKTLAIEISPDKGVIVRAPVWVPLSEIDKFVSDRREWIMRCMQKIENRKAELMEKERNAPPRLTMPEIRELADQAMKLIPDRVEYYAKQIGVSYRNITIRNQRSKWGSCSSKGNLNFNCLLMLTPPEVIDSVIVHELCHRKHMNHSKAFYDEIYRVFPAYDRWDKWLKVHGEDIMRRMTG